MFHLRCLVRRLTMGTDEAPIVEQRPSSKGLPLQDVEAMRTNKDWKNVA